MQVSKNKFILSILMLIPLLVNAAEDNDMMMSLSTGNVIPKSSSYGATFNVGINITKAMLNTSLGKIQFVSSFSESLLKAKTIVNGLTFGYREASGGLAINFGKAIFIRPEVGYAYTKEYFKGGRKNENIVTGIYYAIGLGFQLPNNAMGILKYQPMRGKIEGFIWSYESFF